VYAEKYFRQGLTILDNKKLSEGWSAARIEGNLARLALDRGDYAGGRPALDLHPARAPSRRILKAPSESPRSTAPRRF
jgi:hypothetical protein